MTERIALEHLTVDLGRECWKEGHHGSNLDVVGQQMSPDGRTARRKSQHWIGRGLPGGAPWHAFWSLQAFSLVKWTVVMSDNMFWVWECGKERRWGHEERWSGQWAVGSGH